MDTQKKMTLDEADEIDRFNRRAELASVLGGAAVGVAFVLLFIRVPHWFGSGVAQLLYGAFLFGLPIGGAWLGNQLFNRRWRQPYF
jgi:hypothetical protein